MVARRKRVLIAGAIGLAVAAFVVADRWEVPCRTFDYPPGSPQEKVAQIYRQHQERGPMLVESPGFSEELRTYPVQVILQEDGWHAFLYVWRCNLFGRGIGGMFGGSELIVDKNSLKILRVNKGQ